MKTATGPGTSIDRRALVLGLATMALCACGGGDGGDGTPKPTSYNLQAGYGNLITAGLTTPIALSGTVVNNGVSVSFSGTGTLTYEASVSTTFDNSAASSQVETITGTVTADGQSTPLSTSVTDFYAPTTYAFLGETTASEFDLAQSPIAYPDSVVGGSNGMLGTILRYADSTMSVSLGTAKLSYAVTAPVDSGSPVSVAITNTIFDTTNALVETDVTTFTLSTSNVLSFVSATATSSSGSTLSVSAQ